MRIENKPRRLRKEEVRGVHKNWFTITAPKELVYCFKKPELFNPKPAHNQSN
jgi:hypothetical protein